jgi:type IV pilus assembly protein PilV
VHQQERLQLSLVRSAHPVRQRGLGLIDVLISMAVLAFGLLALVGMQSRLVAQSTEAEARLTGTQLTEELMSLVLVDAGNAGCYTLPTAGTCTSAAARALATSWETKTKAKLPGNSVVTAALVGNLMTVTVNWTGKASTDTHTFQATTDVR